MANFEQFLPIVLKFEGGYVNDPDDPGGQTNRGITIGVFRECSQQLLGLPPTSANLKALTIEQAAIIYKARYWDAIQADSIQLQDLANIICDFYVNAGSNAIRLLQQVLNAVGAKLVEDGAIGPDTVQALAKSRQPQVYTAYKKGRVAYYQRLGQKYPKFLKGWLNRVNSFPDLQPPEGPPKPVSSAASKTPAKAPGPTTSGAGSRKSPSKPKA